MKDNNEIINILTTDYIYLPYSENMELHIKNDEYIYKDDLILSNDTKNIYSTVSGNVLGLTTLNNKKYILIENDYKDKVKKRIGTKKFINKYTKDEFVELINKYKIIENFDTTSKVLIINGIEEYIDDITYNTLLKTNTIEILDTIDALIDIMNIRKCFLAVFNNDEETINTLLNNIGTYPKIDLKMFTPNHIISKKEVLIDKLTKYRNKKYNIQYLNLKSILKMYNLLKKQRPTSNTYLTISNDDNKKVINVKIGSNLNDILNELKIDNKNIIVNGLLSGTHLKDRNFIIDEKINSIYITEIKEYQEKECINCGLCINVCPININPKYMYFNKDKKSKKYKELCINCGLCSYNCPSKINLNKGVSNND